MKITCLIIFQNNNYNYRFFPSKIYLNFDNCYLFKKNLIIELKIDYRYFN